MAGQCFKKRDSDPPVCAVHNVQLVLKHLPSELIGAGLMSFTFLQCPVSGEVVDNETTRE
jgi:hypothetical protein